MSSSDQQAPESGRSDHLQGLRDSSSGAYRWKPFTGAGAPCRASQCPASAMVPAEDQAEFMRTIPYAARLAWRETIRRALLEARNQGRVTFLRFEGRRVCVAWAQSGMAARTLEWSRCAQRLGISGLKVFSLEMAGTPSTSLRKDVIGVSQWRF